MEGEGDTIEREVREAPPDTNSDRMAMDFMVDLPFNISMDHMC